MNLELIQTFDAVELKRLAKITKAKTEEEFLTFIKNKFESEESEEIMAEYLDTDSAVISNVKVEPVSEGQQLLYACIDELIKE